MADQTAKIKKICEELNNQISFISKLRLQGQHQILITFDCGCGGVIAVAKTTMTVSPPPIKLDKV